MEAVERLSDIYRRNGNFHYGEGVTQLSHAMQCAEIARERGNDPAFILAAFYHDIGHLLAFDDEQTAYGHQSHEIIGAAYLSRTGFDSKIVEPVREHVRAKRYLCWSSPGYWRNLSDASRATLEFQGGPFTVTEAVEFQKLANFERCLMLRRIDDEAKDKTYAFDQTDWLFDLSATYLKSQTQTT